MRNKKFVIWDWNGTLLNDVELGHRIFAEICQAHDLGYPTLEDYREYYQHPIDRMYTAAGFDLEKVPMSKIAALWHDGYMGGIDKVKLHHDAITLLEALRLRGAVQTVLSALPHEILLHSIDLNGVSEYFTLVSGLADNLGRSKVDNGHAMLKQMGADPDQVILFGDSSHDFETAQALGIDCVLFGRGYESREKILQHGVRVCDDFGEVLAEMIEGL